jgi:hypothetical protein
MNDDPNPVVLANVRLLVLLPLIAHGELRTTSIVPAESVWLLAVAVVKTA